jgi:hypothetical protein
MGLPSGRPAREALKGGNPEGIERRVRYRTIKGVYLLGRAIIRGSLCSLTHMTRPFGKRLLEVRTDRESFPQLFPRHASTPYRYLPRQPRP